MKIFVDDIRACPDGWVLDRDITSAIRHLSDGNVTEVSLDFDMRHCANKRCQYRNESFEPVYRYLELMPPSRRPAIRIHTGNVAKGQYWAERLGVEYHLFDERDYSD